tara:strand:+ start:137 stop:475 length:339 start_codon:yes stop_codon:yes gene_type:complete
MGKKRRYRKFPQKFGRKYALKYGATIGTTENQEPKIVEAATIKPTLVAAAAPAAEEPPAPTIQETRLESIEPAPQVVAEAIPVKRKTAIRKKTTTTPSKTTRKRTTRAKTTT